MDQQSNEGGGLKGVFRMGDDNQLYDWNNTLEVEYAPGRFLPIDMVYEELNMTEAELVERNVRVGWRGPMVRELDLETLPNVFLEQPDDDDRVLGDHLLDHTAARN